MLTVKNRRYILAILICMIAAGAHASRSDTIFSYYRKGEHVTHGCIYADARKEVCMDMVADLISQFRGNPDQLFGWAFKGLGRQEGDGNGKNEVLIQLNQALYDPSTQIGTLVMDIIVPGLTTFDDVNIESRVTQKDQNDTVSEVSVDIFYSNSLLKKAYGTFFVTQSSEGGTYLSIDIHIRFGWFFNLFITQRRYRNIVEWRTDGFLKNLRDDAERRERAIINEKTKNSL